MSRAAHADARRSLRRILIASVLIGFALNVGVAWICAARVALVGAPVEAQGAEVDPPRTWIVRRWEAPGALRVLSQRGDSPFLAEPSREPERILPEWTGYAKALPAYDAGDAVCESRLADARGWPWLALYAETNRAMTPDPEIRGAFTVAGNAFPVRPLWTGILLNTLAYGAFVFVLTSPWSLRRVHRLWHERCTRCGYPIGSATRCTECGRPIRPPRPRSAPPEAPTSRPSRCGTPDRDA